METMKIKRRVPEPEPGLRFGRLMLTGVVELRGDHWMREALCECGTKKFYLVASLRSGDSRSCGCLAREKSSQRRGDVSPRFAHGGASHTKRHPLYNVWRNMVQRCHSATNAAFRFYGARGVTVCEQWRGPDGFPQFLRDVGERPSEAHSLDRFPNNDGNYEPGNVRWATRREQTLNSRSVKLLTFNGQTMCIADWGAQMGIDGSTIAYRLRHGWSVEEALSTPPRNWGRPGARMAMVSP